MSGVPLFLKKVLEAAFSPAGILALCLATGLLLVIWRRTVRWGRRLLVAGAALYLLVVFSPVADILVRNLEMDYPPLISPEPEPELGTVVVLSGYGEDRERFPVTNNLSEQTVACLVEGIRIYRKLQGARIMPSGGVLREGDRPVAAIMADFLVEMGIPRQSIVIEGRSQTTYENMYETRKLVGSSKFVLVAAAFHLRRAMAVARKLGMNPVPAPAYFWALQRYPQTTPEFVSALARSFARPSLARIGRLQWAFHEYLGYWWYRASGRI